MSSPFSINDSVAAPVQHSVAEDTPIENVVLEGDNIFSCKNCKTHLALSDDIASKDFHCKSGKAYLFSKVVNVTVGVKEDRLLMTGLHTVADILCVKCGTIVGWTYETAHEKSQKYKEGKSILEWVKVSGPDGINDLVTDEARIAGSGQDGVW